MNENRRSQHLIICQNKNLSLIIIKSKAGCVSTHPFYLRIEWYCAIVMLKILIALSF
jgi:hypothetical protein